ncbi:hypothetical protein CHS0354_027294 [Potamilus streckersoni]|uniref:HECT-type E3 ubiquitin transferase n=1 Tax=Potamilus streckersoni TaxID=2493646 RepID=A0AAE0T955_9BIVA|nr:hypothetical protein CHS0354_027294 [Potamilus streckersoni]
MTCNTYVSDITMAAFLKKKVIEPLLVKIKVGIEEVLESYNDKERHHMLSAITKSGVPPEEIALNLGVSLPTVQLILKAESFRRSLENAFDVVSKEIIHKLLEIIKEIQSIKKENLTEKDSKAKATGISEQHLRRECDLDQRDIICQLGLPVADLAQLLDLTEADVAALISADNLSDEIPDRYVESTEFTEAQTKEPREPQELAIVASVLPWNQQMEEDRFSESGSDSTELCEAFSKLRHSLNSGREKITILDRNDIFNEVMELYDKHPFIGVHDLRVKFEGEEGWDYGGLTKDMLASFWTAASGQYFHGEDVLVPHVNLDQIRKGETDLKIIGRILSHTVALTGTLPFNISAVCLISAFHDGNSWMSEMDFLLEEYLMFVNSEERLLMEKAQAKFASLTEDEKGSLLRIFDTHGHTCLPTQANIKEKLVDIAVKVLIHEPARHLQQIKEGMPAIHVEVFWSRLSKTAIRKLTEKLRPTPEKAANSLVPTRQLSDKECEVYSYLIQFVESLNKTSLRTFLQFVTGYTRLPEDGIKINFNHDLKDFSRRPIAHTCSNQLDLPIEYMHYEDFESEMTSILDNPLAMHMNME